MQEGSVEAVKLDSHNRCGAAEETINEERISAE